MSGEVVPFPQPGPEFVAGRCTRCGDYTEYGRRWDGPQTGTLSGAGGIVHADMSECSPLPPQRHALGS